MVWLFLCKAAETLAASSRARVKRVSQKNSCKLSSETTECRRQLPRPPTLPFVYRSEQCRACGMYLVCTRITVWLLVESDALDLYARGQSWPSLEFSRPNFSIFKTCQGLDVARRRIKRISPCMGNVFCGRVFGCTWWAWASPRPWVELSGVWAPAESACSQP